MDSERSTKIEKANMLGVAFSILVYGVHFTLFLAIVRHVLKPCLKKPCLIHLKSSNPMLRRDRLLVAYIGVIFTFATIGMGLQLKWTEIVFIDHHDFPGGPLTYLANEIRNPMNLAVTTIYVVLNWLADGMLFYRFYLVYNRHMLALLASIAMLLSLIVTGSIFLPYIASLSSQLYTDISTVPGIAYLTLSLCINAVLTSLIIGRLLYSRYVMRSTSLGQQDDNYAGVIHMVVESALLYTVVAIAGVISCGISNAMQNTLLPVMGQMQAIPPLLITAMVFQRRETPYQPSFTQRTARNEIRQPSVTSPFEESYHSYASKSSTHNRILSLSYGPDLWSRGLEEGLHKKPSPVSPTYPEEDNPSSVMVVTPTRRVTQ